jgi:NADPH-ferrihemoprotein reductase
MEIRESVHDNRYAVTGPRNKYSFRVPIHVRRSSFKLPQDISRPIVMIGQGTGVAPFRAFVQERIRQMELGRTVGNMILFFGCRKGDGDFIYRDDWRVCTHVCAHSTHHQDNLTIVGI